MRASLVTTLGLLILVIALPAQSKDSSFRCGNTFIDVSDSRARVLYHCGEPYRREVIGYVRSTEKEELIEMVVEAWTYDTTADLINIITFNSLYNR